MRDPRSVVACGLIAAGLAIWIGIFVRLAQHA